MLRDLVGHRDRAVNGSTQPQVAPRGVRDALVELTTQQLAEFLDVARRFLVRLERDDERPVVREVDQRLVEDDPALKDHPDTFAELAANLERHVLLALLRTNSERHDLLGRVRTNELGVDSSIQYQLNHLCVSPSANNRCFQLRNPATIYNSQVAQLYVYSVKVLSSSANLREDNKKYHRIILSTLSITLQKIVCCINSGSVFS